jgi:hypothetical protein
MLLLYPQPDLAGSDSDHARLYFLDPLDGSTWLQLLNVTSSTPGLDSGEVRGGGLFL